MTRTEDSDFVWVRRQWSGTSAQYAVADFQSPHWSQEAGGRGGTQPRQLIFGYVSCDGAVKGEIGHSGSHGPCPHRIKVCALPKDNTSLTMTVLRLSAGTPPPAAATAADRVLTELEDAGGELLNSDLWEKAALSKAHGAEVLGRLEHDGAIESASVMAPNRAGRTQRQVVWRLLRRDAEMTRE